MKKSLLVIILVLLSFLVTAQDSPQSSINDEDVETIKNLTNQIPIDPDTGKFKNPLNKSKAEERIEKINNWLEKNTSWLKIAFGMVPEISWLFAFNLYFWLLLLVILILNENFLSSYIDGNKSRIIGAVIFIILLVTKIILKGASLTYQQLKFLYDYGPIGIGILLIIGAVIAIFFPKTLSKLNLYLKVKKELKAKQKENLDRKVLDETVKGITQSE